MVPGQCKCSQHQQSRRLTQHKNAPVFPAQCPPLHPSIPYCLTLCACDGTQNSAAQHLTAHLIRASFIPPSTSNRPPRLLAAQYLRSLMSSAPRASQLPWWVSNTSTTLRHQHQKPTVSRSTILQLRKQSCLTHKPQGHLSPHQPVGYPQQAGGSTRGRPQRVWLLRCH